MIWVAWRQFRTPALVSFVALLALAVALAATGSHLVHLYDTTVKPCRAIGDCATAGSAFGAKDNGLQVVLTLLMQVTPALLGVFWGAPLVARELETGTWRLAWTQSVTRTRWLAVKLGVIALAAAALVALLSLAVTWWYAPLDKVGANRFDGSIFGERGIAPIGYVLFAFAVGVLAGVVIRNVLPAMATTLVAFIAVRLLFSQLIRPRLLAPVHAAFALAATVNGFVSSNGGVANLTAGAPNDANMRNAWVYSARIIDSAGHPLTPQATASACPDLTSTAPPAGLPPPGSAHHLNAVPSPGAGQALQACAARLSTTYHTVLTYQPADRYWTFQIFEAGIYVAVAVILAGLAIWWLRNRLS